VELLIENGAWMGSRDGDGDTPIFYAIREGKNLVVERLVVDFGLNIEEANEDGETPLEFCKSIDDEEMEKLIISLYPKPPVPQTQGKPEPNRNGGERPKEEKNNRNGGEEMDIDISLCSLSSSAGSRTKLDFSFTPDFSSSQTAF